MALYGNGLAPDSALIDFEGYPASPDMHARLSVAIPKIRARGASITINQIYRYLGTQADRSIGASDYSADEAKASETSDGTGNQWYQAGRMANGSTPSAATPGTSNHGDWDIGAVDSNCSDESIRDEEFVAVGLTRTISSESWHSAATSPFTETDEDMPLNQEDLNSIITGVTNAIVDQFRLAPQPRETALNVSQNVQDAIGQFKITVDDGSTPTLGPVLNDIMQQSRRSLAIVQLIAAHEGVDISSVK